MKRPGTILAALPRILAVAIVAAAIGSMAPAVALAGEEGSNAAAAASGAGDPIYVDLAPLVLPVIDGDRVQQVLQFTITVQVADEKAADHIRSIKPLLTDAYIQDLYGALERRRVLDGKVLDIERLKEELRRVSTNVLGDKGFEEILIQRISQRMM